ncbi:MAG: hypothetical protein H2049_00060 [Porphyrobacter sp.]|nr:hypothetical protein [Porphyrobacter sp.]
MQTERVTYLTNAEQKAALEAFAKARGESVGNIVREAVAEYMTKPSAEEEAELIALTQQVNEAIPRMNATLDRISDTIRNTRAEMDAFFREKGIRK